MVLRFTGRARRRERSDRRGRAGVAPARRPLEALEVRGLLSQVFTVTNTGDGGVGSLRWAIGQVDADTTDTQGARDRIDFAIPASDPGYNARTGAWTIAPATALPAVTRAVVIDGYSQPGAVANTSATADDAALKIELSGVRASLASGLAFEPGSGSLENGNTYGQATPGWLTAEMSGVRGLAIHGFAADVSVDTSLDTMVEGCFLGLDASGKAPASGTMRTDVGVELNAQFLGSTRVGGTLPAARNLIANCAVGVWTPNGGGGQVAGNLIGTDRTGLHALPNVDGVSESVGGPVIGGTDAGTGNVISGNLDAGIVINNAGAQVEGNDIGTDLTGVAALGNGVAGIRVSGGFLGQIVGNVISGNGALGTGRLRGGVVLTGSVSDCRVTGNFIGTDASATRNLGNIGSGIVMDSGSSCPFDANAIAFNTKLGIDLVGGTEDSFGVTENSPGGPHAGPNHLQNYPVLTSAAASATSTAIGGTLNGTPNATFKIDFYSNPTADPSGHGQGLHFLGSTTVVTDASGNADFRFNASGDLAGEFLTATATVTGMAISTQLPFDTSEFSADLQATASSQSADLTLVASATPSPHLSTDKVTAQFVVTNGGPDDAQGLLATLVIPGGETVLSLTSSDPGVKIPALPASNYYSSATVPLLVPALASHQSVTFTLVLGGDYDVSATMAVASLTPDPIPTNNAATAASRRVFATSTSLSVNPTRATFGQRIGIGAVPSDMTRDAPSGSVTFTIDGVPETVPIVIYGYELGSTGSAYFATSTLASGTHRITAHYNGNGTDLPSDATPVTVVVDPASTATVLTAKANPAAFGLPTTFTAAVASITGAVPMGRVTFVVDGVDYHEPLTPLAGGHAATATLTLPALGLGTHAVSAHYGGTADFTGSTSATIEQSVIVATTTTALLAPPSPSGPGQPVTFTAVVASSDVVGTPTGAVTFLVDGIGYAEPLVPSADGRTGTATFATTALGAGQHGVIAVYHGSAGFAPSQSPALVETILAPAPPAPPRVVAVETPPRVVTVERFGYHAMPTRLAVVFDGPLDPASATAVANYRLVGPNGRPVPIVAAAAAPGGSAVVLQPEGRLNLHRTYHLVIFGTPPGGVRGASGAYLGSSPIETITARNLVRTLAPARPRAVASHAKPQPQAVDAVLASLRLARARGVRAAPAPLIRPGRERVGPVSPAATSPSPSPLPCPSTVFARS